MISKNKKVCVITDNEYLYNEFKKIVIQSSFQKVRFDFFCSENNTAFWEKYKEEGYLHKVDVKNVSCDFWKNYDLILSLHCKQIFPQKMVENNRCVNVHPGYNPYNRGWYPQVFSILNKMPVGVTIHEMDSQLDHGAVIFQERVKVQEYDTSWDVYKRILETEIKMIRKHLWQLIDGNYCSCTVSGGNLNLKRDFNNLLEIDMDKKATYREVIDFLRAMTFPQYDNAYFYDAQGNKVYVQILLKNQGGGYRKQIKTVPLVSDRRWAA